LTITYWIQHADFESEEFGLIGRADAQTVFKKHNWKSELQQLQAREDQGKETCDPGIGFVSNDKRILHLCPQASGRVLCHYHFDSTWWFLWLVPLRGQKQEYWFENKRDDAVEVVSRFFANDHKWLKQRAKTGNKVFELQD
jgi:hypothetical protein